MWVLPFGKSVCTAFIHTFLKVFEYLDAVLNIALQTHFPYPWHNDLLNVFKDILKAFRVLGCTVRNEGPQISWFHIWEDLSFIYLLQVICNIVHHLLPSLAELCSIHGYQSLGLTRKENLKRKKSHF